MNRPLVPLSLFMIAAAALAQSPAAPAAPNARVVPYPIDLPESFAAAVERGTRTMSGRPGPAYWMNHAHYEIAAELDPAAARLTGTVKVTYKNASPDELDRLVVHLRQNLLLPDAERTRPDLAPTHGMEVASVEVDGKSVRPRIHDTRMTVRLSPALPPGGETTLVVHYAFDVPKAGEAPRMGHEGQHVFYLGYWYPQLAVCDDLEGWVADQYRGNGEFYMDYADYDLAITAPQGYLVRATGELQNAEEVLTPSARERLATIFTTRDIVHVVDKDDLAAGRATATSPSGKLTWRFHAERVRDAAVSIADTYVWDATHAVVKDKDGPGKDGRCAIHAVYETNAGDWVRGAEYARHTIEYLSANVHPYPWPHMTACEGIIGGGMEYPMMTIVGGRRPEGTITHELTHMWFPMLVGSNEKRYAWQDEGFTSFWTTLCRADANHRESPWKADVLSYANTVRRGGDAVCMRHADAYGDDNYGFATYGKPAAILHQLRAMLGDATFFAAFRRYAADWAFKHPTPYDFFHTFADASGVDLEPYFRTWFFETWKLDHAIADVVERDGATFVTIADRGRALHFAEVEVVYADDRTERRSVPVDFWRGQTSAELKFGPHVVAVHLDPDVTSLDCDRANNDWPAK